MTEKPGPDPSLNKNENRAGQWKIYAGICGGVIAIIGVIAGSGNVTQDSDMKKVGIVMTAFGLITVITAIATLPRENKQ